MRNQTSPIAPNLSSVDNLIDFVEARIFALLHEKQVINALEPKAVFAAHYHLSSGGSRVRAKLALEASLALGIETNDAITLATTVELLHNASLIHDDLQDRDRVRRNMETVWVKYGDNIAICTGDFLISAAYCAVSVFSKPQLLPALIGAMHANTSAAIQGQCADLSLSRHAATDISHYTKIAAAKSGALLSLPLELALIAAGQNNSIKDAMKAAEDFAIGYQIVDDLHDLEEDKNNSTTARLNAVLVLSSSLSFEDAKLEAKKLARIHLKNAADIANALPQNCGLLLLTLAQTLSKTVDQP